LTPTEEDGHGTPLAFTALPDDATLRYDLVRVLMLGPWKSATTIAELMTKTGWGKTKPALSDMEISFAALGAQAGVDVDDIARGLGIDGDTLRKKIKARKTTK
jgi:hypothetical protein